MSLFEMEEQFQSQIVTKNIRTIISSIETSLSSNEDYTISYLSNHFFGADSQIVIKSFLSQVKQIITKKTTKISNFESMSKKLIDENFWNSDKPNFYIGLNAINFFDEDYLFGDVEQQKKFVELICKCYNDSLSNEELVAGSKIIEKFVLGNHQIIEMNACESENIFNKVENNSHSLLASTLLKVVNLQTDFECTFSLVRSIVELITEIFSKDSIEMLYGNEKCELNELLGRYK